MYLYFELRKTKEINLRENMRRNSMTVLNLHKEERLKIAKEILNKNIKNPIVVKGTTYNEGEALLIFVNGKVLAEKLKLTVKNELKKSDLSNKYLVELDFDNSNIDNNSLYFEKIMDSSIFYRIPSIIDDSEDEEEIQELKKFVEGVVFISKDIEMAFDAVELDVKTELEFLDLTIASPIEVETVFQRRTTEEETGRIQQYILPHEKGFETPVEISENYVTRRFERKQPVQIISTKTTTITETLSNGYPANNLISKVFLELILKEIENTIEYQTIAELTVEQYSFVNWAKLIVKTVDEHIRQFDKLYYIEEELRNMIK